MEIINLNKIKKSKQDLKSLNENYSASIKINAKKLYDKIADNTGFELYELKRN